MTTTWALKGITADRGTCEHCGRRLSRLFRVASPEGHEMVVGRNCSAALTGFKWSVAQAERAELVRRAESAAEAKWGSLYADLRAMADQPAGYGPASEAVIALRDNRWRLPDAELEATARRVLQAV